MSRVVFAALACSLLASACRSDGQRATREEATLLVARFDRMQAASGEPRSALLGELEATPCSLPLACEFRSVCVKAYRSLLQAKGDLVEIRRQLDAPAGAGASSADAEARLSDAEMRIEGSRAEASRCVALRGRLVREQDVR